MFDKSMENRINNIMSSYDEYPDMVNLHKDNYPDREVLTKLLGQLRALIFPGYFERMTCKEQIRDHLLWNLESINCSLKEQIAKAMLFNNDSITASEKEEIFKKSAKISSEFLDEIPEIRSLLHKDALVAYKGDPSAKNLDEIIFSYPGFFSIFVYRISHKLLKLGTRVIPRILSEYAHSATGIDIHPGATIGESFFIDHGTGIVIGETTVIGNNVKIYQGVTLGALSLSKGRELRGDKRHPSIEDNVTIYSGATILGGDTVIGEGSTIGGNVFLINSVEKGSKVYANHITQV